MKKQLFLFLALLVSIHISAQERIFYTVSTTGRLSSGWSTCSLPIQFNRSNECIKLNSGIVVHAGSRGLQSFIMTCRTTNNEPIIQLTLFPNPATMLAKLISSALLRNEQYLIISVLDSQGKMFFQLKKSPDQLLAGIDIDVQHLPAGSYFLRVDGQVFHQAIPFIKMN